MMLTTKVTAEQVEERVRQFRIAFWGVHDCSMCGYPCGYHFHPQHGVWYDNGCDCTGRSSGSKRGYHDVADLINMQETDHNGRNIRDEYWRSLAGENVPHLRVGFHSEADDDAAQ